MALHASHPPELILQEVNQEFGSVPAFWKALSKSPHILESYWESFESLLGTGELPRETKIMISYECALADGCPKCRGGFRRLLEDIGVDKKTILDLERDIKSSKLDEETKNVLIYAYHAAKDPHNVDDKFIYAFRELLGEAKLVEAGAWLNDCKMLINTAHSLNMHVLE